MNYNYLKTYLNLRQQKTKNLAVIVTIILFISLLLPVSLKAADDIIVESLIDNKVFNDFVVGPGKIEMELAPGEKGTFDLLIANRLGTEKTFSITEEDFTGSNDPLQTVVLLGSDRGPYSLKDYLKISTSTIDIIHGTKVRVPVSVSVPKNAEPGGLYGSVIVGTISKNENTNSAGGVISSNPIISRIGTLVFIRVKGEVVENGKLNDFKIAGNKKVLLDYDSIRFNILFQNEGNVHLNPKGTITIKNMLGTNVGTINVEPWFAMPKSLRFREVEWKPVFLFGKYSALATIDRGYGSFSDEDTITFWVIPWKVFLGVVVLLGILIVIVKKIFRKRNDRK